MCERKDLVIFLLNNKSKKSRTLLAVNHIFEVCMFFLKREILGDTVKKVKSRQASSSHNQSSLVLVSDCVKSEIKKQIGRR